MSERALQAEAEGREKKQREVRGRETGKKCQAEEGWCKGARAWAGLSGRICWGHRAGLSHLSILSQSLEGLALRISESLLESSQRGVTEQTAGVPPTRQCSQCEDGSKRKIVLQRKCFL